MEVDINLLPAQCQQITSMYSSSVQSFPLDIKMRLVPKLSEVPKVETQAKVLKLLDHQARFLIRSATSKLSPASHSNLTMAQMMNLLRSTSCTYLTTNQTVTQLFHAVSPMTKSNICLIRYLLQHCTAVLETLAQVQTFLPGFQAPSESLLPSDTSSQLADSDDLSQCPPSQQTTRMTNVQEGIVLDGRIQTTTNPSQPLQPSSAHPRSSMTSHNQCH